MEILGVDWADPDGAEGGDTVIVGGPFHGMKIHVTNSNHPELRCVACGSDQIFGLVASDNVWGCFDCGNVI